MILQLKLDSDERQSLGASQVLGCQRKSLLLRWAFLWMFSVIQSYDTQFSSHCSQQKTTSLKKNRIGIVSSICHLLSFPICRVGISRQHWMVAKSFEILGWRRPKSTVLFLVSWQTGFHLHTVSLRSVLCYLPVHANNDNKSFFTLHQENKALFTDYSAGKAEILFPSLQ